MKIIIEGLLFFLSLLLSGCLFPSGWYAPGIETRLTIQGSHPEIVEGLHRVITASLKYEYLGERRGAPGEIFRFYQKQIVPATSRQAPYVGIRVFSSSESLSVGVYDLYGRKDKAAIAEIDTTSDIIEREISSHVGQQHIRVEKMTTGPPIL
jgi:hypothetical protein